MTPPRVAAAVLRAILHPSDRGVALADLHEEFDERCDRDGVASARRWYRAQARHSIAPALRRRVGWRSYGRPSLAVELKWAWRGLRARRSGALAHIVLMAIAVGAANPIDLDGRTVVFMAVVALFATMVTSLPVAWRVARPVMADAIRRASSGLTVSRRQVFTHHAPIGVQVTLSIVLLIGATLFVRSYAARLGTKGYDSANLVTLTLTHPRGTARSAADLEQAVMARLQGAPAVKSFARTSRLLPGGPRGGEAAPLWIEGHASPSARLAQTAYDVDSIYFDTIGIRLVSGRAPRLGDPPSLVVVDESFARRFWPGGNAVGARYSLGSATAPGRDSLEIVGVASHVGLDTAEMPQGGEIFLVHHALARDAAPLTFVIRLAAPAGWPDVLTAIRADAGGAIVQSAAMDDRYADSYGDTRIAAGLGTSFALIALLVAMVGMYGVTSRVVAGRAREIGVRVALGADRRDVHRLVRRPIAAFVAAGALIGIGIALAASRWLGAQLFGVPAIDPATYVGVTVLLGLAAVAAAGSPAARIDPIVTLRAD